jgi:hypothetical protein
MITAEPTAKSDAAAGDFFVPYRVAASTVTVSIAPALVATIQVAPEMLWMVPRMTMTRVPASGRAAAFFPAAAPPGAGGEAAADAALEYDAATVVPTPQAVRPETRTTAIAAPAMPSPSGWRRANDVAAGHRCGACGASSQENVWPPDESSESAGSSVGLFDVSMTPWHHGNVGAVFGPCSGNVKARVTGAGRAGRTRAANTRRGDGGRA